MRHSIDLHGLPHERAIIKTEDALISASLSTGFEFEIITGNSTLLQEKIIKMVVGHHFDYYIPANNLGIVVVTYNLL
tara:strand:- start:3565 stop:3795 length:231 start_codon:yes stop_codon:yes gene_type:complete